MAVTKVKGHATDEDVLAGVASWEDKVGNDCADALARTGASEHIFYKDSFKTAMTRKELAASVQSMMVDFLEARAAAQRSGMLDGCVLLAPLSTGEGNEGVSDELISISSTEMLDTGSIYSSQSEA